MIRRLRIGAKTLAEWLVVTAICVGFAALAGQTNLLWRLDGVIYDAGLDAFRAPPDEDIVIVAIDDRSLAEIGRWPWSRGVHAALIERLAAMGARVIAFDIILHEPAPDDVAGDRALAAAIGAHGGVVLPVTHATHAARSDGEGRPSAPFADAAAALGHIHIELDPDGIARSVYLWEGMNSARHPQLALAMLGLDDPARLRRFTPPEDASQPGWARAEWMRIPFRGPPGTFRHVSYVDILRGEVPEALLRDAVVLVGATAVGMGDMVPTPTSGHAGLMPGVEVHANILAALRRGEVISTVAPVWVTLSSALAVLALMLVMLRTRPRATLVGAFGFALLLPLGAWWALSQLNLWFPPASAILAGMIAYPLWSWRRLEASRRYFDVELEALRTANAGIDDAAPERAGPTPSRAIDSYLDHIGVVREATRRQRELQRGRDETMHFLSHDLRAPLAAIVSSLESVRESGRGLGDDAELADRLERNARNALSLAENLVRLVRAEGLDPVSFAEVNLALLVQDAADEVWALAHAAQVRLESEISPDDEGPPQATMGDADLLRRAVVNLLTNAIKYTPAGGRVTLRLLAETSGWAIEVADTGCGIAEAQQSQLFKRFSRLPTEQNRTLGGIGLGLLMVRTVVERHRGSISVHSKPGEGSTFTLHLPGIVEQGD